jgi:acetyltransferase
MTIQNIEHFFDPRSVALIGASAVHSTVGYTVMQNLLQGGFDGDIWLVNPHYGELEGRRCYPDVQSLPDAPDLAVLATPPATIPSLVDALGQRGTRAAVVITAGLRTEGLQEEMMEAAKRHGMRIMGPNCIGVLSPRVGLNASFVQKAPLVGDIALVSQSGALLTSFLDWANAQGIGFSHMVSLGDMADIGVADMLDYLAADVHSHRILLYIESIKNARGFLSAGKSASRAKPVAAIKAGRHPESAKAAASHTGAMAGSDAVYDAAFERTGLLRVRDLMDFFNAAEALSNIRGLLGERLSILTNGGGAGILAVDTLKDLGGQLAELAPETLASLDQHLPHGWSHGNPVDIIGDANPERYKAALSEVIDDPNTDAVLVLYCPTSISSSADVAETVVDTVRAKKIEREWQKPVLTCWLGEESVQEARGILNAAGLASFETPAAAVSGFMHLVRYARGQAALMQTPEHDPISLAPERDVAKSIIDKALQDGRTALNNVEAKGILSAYGIPVVETKIATTPEEVATIAEAIISSGKPNARCAVKIWSPDISHKSDVGGIRLDIASSKEARAAAEAMLSHIREIRPDARLEGFTVEPMVARKHAHELIVGLAEDATFGPIVLFGAGGTSVEVTNDKALALPPLDMMLARRLMERTRIARLLKGYRDRPAADLDAIAAILVKISMLAADFPEIGELDINPLLANEHGVIAVDARAFVRRTDAGSAGRNSHFAIRPYPRETESRETLPDGAQVLIRPVRPEDERYYADFFAHLSEEDVRMRLFSPRKSLSHAFVARLTQIDYAREMAFIAISPEDNKLIGVSRMIASPDYDRAEYAVIVRSDYKGKGLGWALMQKLIAYAQGEGLKEMYGHVLAVNVTMLKMCRELGFTVKTDPDDASIFLVSLDLTKAGNPGDRL